MVAAVSWLPVQPAGTEPDHLLFRSMTSKTDPGECAPRSCGSSLSAVDRRYPHLFEWKRVAAVIQTSYNGGDRFGRRRTLAPHPSMNTSNSRDRLLRKRLSELSAVWPDFVSGQMHGLHKTRFASRRIGAKRFRLSARRRLRRRSRNSAEKCARSRARSG